MKSRSGWKFTAVIVAASFLASAQSDVVPVNDRPNPYQPGASWGALPNGRQWGAVTAVDVDRDRRSIWRQTSVATIYGAVVPARQLLRYAGGQEPR